MAEGRRIVRHARTDGYMEGYTRAGCTRPAQARSCFLSLTGHLEPVLRGILKVFSLFQKRRFEQKRDTFSPSLDAQRLERDASQKSLFSQQFYNATL